MRRALLSVGVALTSVGALAPPSGVVRACSCAENPVAVELERETAKAVVAGRQLEYADLSADEQTIDRRWLFRVDDRYRGDTPDVIEVRVESEQGACDDVVTRLPSVLLLGDPEPDGWYRYPTCRDLYRTVDLAPFFDDVWSIDGRGPPTVISAVRTATHNLVVLDGVGDVLGYLPGPGATWGLSMCPGAATMLQLRVADAGAELVVWDLSTWSTIGSMSLPQIDTSEIERPIPLTCITSDAASAFVAWRYGLDVDLTTSAVTERVQEEYPATISVGPDATLSIGSADESWVVRADGQQDPVFTGPRAVNVFLISSTSISGDGWNVASIYNVGVERTELRTEHVGPNGAQPVLSLDLGVAVYPFTAVTLDGAIAAALPPLPSEVPDPVYSRSGSAVQRSAPTLPGHDGSATAETSVATTSAGAGPVAAVIGPKTDPVEGVTPSDDDGSASAIVLVLVGVVAAVVAWGLVRRRPREA